MPFENAWTIGFTILFFVAAIVLQRHNRAQRRAELEAELVGMDLELIDVRIWTSGGKYDKTERFELKAKRKGDSRVYEATGSFHQNVPLISWHGVNPVLEDHHAALAERDWNERAAGLTVDQEVAMRLDAITARPGAMLEHDLDGSGHIDSQEWDALRAKVRAEVLAERAEGGSDEEAEAYDSAVAEEDAPEGTAW